VLARSRNVLEIALSYIRLKHETAKSDAWKYFSLLFEKQGADSGSLTEVKYFCVCNACKRVYAYKASGGSGFRDEDVCLYVALYLSVLQELQAQTSTMFVCCLLPSQ